MCAVLSLEGTWKFTVFETANNRINLRLKFATFSLSLLLILTAGKHDLILAGDKAAMR